MDSPVRQIQAMFGDEFYDMFEEALDAGYVYCGADCCVAAIETTTGDLLRQDINKGLDKVWYINFYAGDLKRVLDLIPFDLKWVAFKRQMKSGDKIKFYDMAKLKSRLRGSYGRK